MQYEDGIDITEGMGASQVEILKGYCEEKLAEEEEKLSKNET